MRNAVKQAVEFEANIRTFCLFSFVLVPLFSLCVKANADAVKEFGGSNYLSIRLDPTQLGKGRNWKDSSVFRTPTCQYDAETGSVDAQLESMRRNGQKKLALMLWFTHLDKADGCSGFLLNSSSGQMAPRALRNLRRLLNKTSSLGFDEVQIRFAPMGENLPQQWREWNQSRFDENWGFISSTIVALSGSAGPRVVYDLSVELAGIKGQPAEYVRRMWAAYTQKFPVSGSYGFSMAVAPGRTSRFIQDLREVGPLPSEIAIDTYDSVHPGLRVVAEEMRAQGVNLPILIQETLYADPAIYQSIIKQAHQYGVEVNAIMQWPLRKGAHTHITEASTSQYIYKPVP